MKEESKIIKQIRLQLAHCMACYGDEPERLMYKLETLVLEWYDKGKQAGYEAWRKSNHDYIQQFLNMTVDDDSDSTKSVKATIAQFLSNVKHQFNLIANEQVGMLSREDIVQSQIDQLRICIVDLQRILNLKEERQ